MANGDIIPLVNMKKPSNANYRSAPFRLTLTATPFSIDFRALKGSDLDGTPFRPYGVLIDNSAGTGPLKITFSSTGYTMTCKTAGVLNLPYPAGPYETAAITGLGVATIIFVDYPVDSFSQ